MRNEYVRDKIGLLFFIVVFDQTLLMRDVLCIIWLYFML